MQKLGRRISTSALAQFYERKTCVMIVWYQYASSACWYVHKCHVCTEACKPVGLQHLGLLRRCSYSQTSLREKTRPHHRTDSMQTHVIDKYSAQLSWHVFPPFGSCAEIFRIWLPSCSSGLKAHCECVEKYTVCLDCAFLTPVSYDSTPCRGLPWLHLNLKSNRP